ncbi:GIN domain-containing protein [Phenylobacterium sp.]|uniref:GIN domain-containing protein n=1 Tax=Phenylobacterium sp. TaxID=1871053 RepID=UPI003922A5CC
MIRVLTMIAVTGFLLAVACLTAAVMIGGPDAIARGSWNIASSHWDGHDHWGWDRDFDADFDLEDGPASGPQTTRTLSWNGGPTLKVRVPAEIRYVQADGPGSVVVTGPAGAVERVSLRDGELRLRRHHWMNRRLTVVVTAPGVHRFDLAGATRLRLENYRQAELTLYLAGAADVRASGQTDKLDLKISGAGNADLGELKVRDANVDISGAGHARIAPTGRADLEISGMGNITLLTKPAELETDISGAGAILREDSKAEPAKPAEAPEAKTRT